MHKKRIVLLVGDFPKISETFIVNKFLGLAGKGFEVYMHCYKFDRSAQRVFNLDKKSLQKVHQQLAFFPVIKRPLLFLYACFKVFAVAPKHGFRYFKRGWHLFKSGIFKKFYVDAQIIHLKPDILHFEFGIEAIKRLYLKKLLDCKIVVSFRGYDLNYFGLEKSNIYEEVWREADGLHFLGEDLLARAKRRGYQNNKFHVLIPPAIDLAFFSKGDFLKSNSVTKIVSVGRLHWKKGYDTAIYCMKLLRDAGHKFDYVLIGDGPDRTRLLFLIKEFGLETNCRLLGSTSKSGIKKELSSADIFFHPALSEGFCNAVLEAQAMEIPVVTSNADGLSENIIDGETGFVVEILNHKVMIKKLELLIGDIELRKKMGSSGRRRVEKYFKLEDQIQQFYNFYFQVLNH